VTTCCHNRDINQTTPTERHTMRTYQLTATLADKTVLTSITAHDDASAMMDAIPYIMDKAHKDQLGPWAKGLIALRDEEGYIIETMEAK
jgi:hypothetical protein